MLLTDTRLTSLQINYYFLAHLDKSVSRFFYFKFFDPKEKCIGALNFAKYQFSIKLNHNHNSSALWNLWLLGNYNLQPRKPPHIRFVTNTCKISSYRHSNGSKFIWKILAKLNMRVHINESSWKTTKHLYKL